jgi:hypothetical protein
MNGGYADQSGSDQALPAVAPFFLVVDSTVRDTPMALLSLRPLA